MRKRTANFTTVWGTISEKHPCADVLLFIPCILVLGLILLRRCRFGFGDIDEAFYLTIPYRLMQGDALLVSEWHVSQLSGLLLLPAVKLFVQLRGGTESIILAFRYLYVLVMLVSSALLFLLLRKRSKAGAFFAALAFLIYAPFSIPALSYNSMGIITLTLAAALLCCTENRLSAVGAGILYSMSVLCCPFLAVLCLYFLLCFRRGGKSGEICDELSDGRKGLYFFLGIGLSVIAFFIFVLSRADIKQIVDSVPHILEDPEHTDSIFHKLLTYPRVIVQSRKTALILLGYAAAFLLGLLSKREAWKRGAVLASLLLGAAYCICFALEDRYINRFIFPLNVTALVCYVSSDRKRLRPLFRCIWIPGMIYTLCLHCASNQKFLAIASASAAALPGSIVIIWETVRAAAEGTGHKALKRVLTVSCVLVFALQFGCTAYSRCNDVFVAMWVSPEGILPVEDQTEYIEYGPEKGLFVTPDNWVGYVEKTGELAYLGEDTKSVLFFTSDTWLYLCGDWRMGSYSAWLPEDSNTTSRLLDYYALGYNTLPEKIFVRQKAGAYIEPILEEYGYTLSAQTEKGSVIFGRPAPQR